MYTFEYSNRLTQRLAVVLQWKTGKFQSAGITSYTLASKARAVGLSCASVFQYRHCGRPACPRPIFCAAQKQQHFLL